MQKTKYEIKKVGQPEIIGKVKKGKWQATAMRFNKVKTPVDLSARDCIPEQEFSQVRVCVQHSRFDMRTKNWNNQSIWVNDVTELMVLKAALEEFLDSYLLGDKVQEEKVASGYLESDCIEVA